MYNSFMFVNKKVLLIVAVVAVIGGVFYSLKSFSSKNTSTQNQTEQQTQLTQFYNHGLSMEPTYKSEQPITVNALYYDLNQPQRGDVILFKTPGKENIEVIKRIVGLPNESVEIKDGNLFINGQQLNEPYLKEQNTTVIDTTMDIYAKSHPKIVLATGEYFVMGDNRMRSSDSRSFGLVNKQLIIGKVE